MLVSICNSSSADITYVSVVLRGALKVSLIHLLESSCDECKYKKYCIESPKHSGKYFGFCLMTENEVLTSRDHLEYI